MDGVARIGAQGTQQAGSNNNFFNTSANATGKSAFLYFTQDLKSTTYAPGASAPSTVEAQNINLTQEAEVPSAGAEDSGSSITVTREYTQNVERTVTYSDGSKEVFTANTEAFLEANGDAETPPETSFDLTQTAPEAALPEPEAKPEIKADVPTAKPEAKPEIKADVPTAKPEAKPEVKADVPTAKPEAKPEIKADVPTAKPEVVNGSFTLPNPITVVEPLPMVGTAENTPKADLVRVDIPPIRDVAAPVENIGAEDTIQLDTPPIEDFAPMDANPIFVRDPAGEPKAPASPAAPVEVAAPKEDNRIFSFASSSSSTTSSSSSETFTIGRNFTSSEKTTEQISFSGGGSSTTSSSTSGGSSESFTRITTIPSRY